MTVNIGQSGLESIRINGRKISELPLGQGNEAKEGLPAFLKTDMENKVNNVLAKYPRGKLPNLRASIKECKDNIERIKGFKADLKSKIAGYRKLISDCEFRDREMAKYSADNPADAAAMKALRLRYPPYDIEAMHQQIVQFEEGITRSDEVIEKDYNSIAEISRVIALVEQRDKELLTIK